MTDIEKERVKVATIYINGKGNFGISPDMKALENGGVLNEFDDLWLDLLTGTIDWATTTLANDLRDARKKHEDYVKGKMKNEKTK